MARPQLFIIPGLGDRKTWYWLFAWAWRLRGYRVRIFVFGWEVPGEPFEQKLAGLLGAIDHLPEPLDIIGVSAGGTAALHALSARPACVHKVVTVSSPYGMFAVPENRPLTGSLQSLGLRLKAIDPELKKRVLSVHGRRDHVVEPDWSRYPDIAEATVPGISHGTSIFLALTFCAGPIKRFLRTSE